MTKDKTAAERQALRREKLRAAGMVQKNLYCHPDDWPAIRELAATLASKRATATSTKTKTKTKTKRQAPKAKGALPHPDDSYFIQRVNRPSESVGLPASMKWNVYKMVDGSPHHQEGFRTKKEARAYIDEIVWPTRDEKKESAPASEKTGDDKMLWPS